MRTSEEQAELRRLQERAFGGDTSTLTPEEADRLRALSPGASQPPHPLAAERRPDAEGTPPVESDAAPGPSRRLVPWPLIVLALVLSATSFVAGIVASAWIPAVSPPSELPEFSRPQTDEDLLDGVGDLDLDPASTRFVAILAGYQVYLARPANWEGLCVVARFAADESMSSASCGGGGPTPTVEGTFGVSDELTIAVGPLGPLEVAGSPVELSENVTAYVVE